MQEGGYAWQDLVIFLRATHAELTRAGYTELDPHHELFLLYRPFEVEDEPGVDALSVLNPTRVGGALLSPCGTSRTASKRSKSRRTRSTAPGDASNRLN